MSLFSRNRDKNIVVKTNRRDLRKNVASGEPKKIRRRLEDEKGGSSDENTKTDVPAQQKLSSSQNTWLVRGLNFGRFLSAPGERWNKKK